MKRTQLLIFTLTAAALLFGVTSTEAGIIEVTPHQPEWLGANRCSQRWICGDHDHSAPLGQWLP